MDERSIYLVGLLGLRALAEFDPFEYTRSTDLSKQELEKRIKHTLEQSSSESAMPSYNQLQSILVSTSTPVQLGMLLRQFYSLCLLSVQQESAQRREQIISTDESKFFKLPPKSPSQFSEPYTDEQELVRLSVMRLLRYLPPYRTLFELRMKNSAIDCLLSPNEPDLPSVIVEVKSHAGNRRRLKEYRKQIKTLRDSIDPAGLGILIFAHTHDLTIEASNDSEEGIFVLFYNANNDELDGPDFEMLLKRVGTV